MSDIATTPATGLGIRPTLFLAAAALQIGCGAVFGLDVLVEIRDMTPHRWVETASVIALAIGGILSLREYWSLHRHSVEVVKRNDRVEQELRAASGAFQDVITQHFDRWELTEAERAVALLSIKGASIAEIAVMRATREGTIKALNSSIYRKSGVSSRAELISVVIEELIAGLETGVDGKRSG